MPIDPPGARPRVVLILPAFVVSLAVWLSVYYGLRSLASAPNTAVRLVFALKCVCVAVLFAFVTGIEAVSHERLQTDAFDPLAHRESPRLEINLRYLQNTLEQLFVFVPGLLALSLYCAPRTIIATTVVWILSRAAFWIGYHCGSQYRVIGLTGVAQSLVVLLYVCARFGYEAGGALGAAVPLALFGAIEIVLVRGTRAR